MCAIDEFNYRLYSLFKFYIQPVLDVKPYLPYCDSIQGAEVPEWVKVYLQLSCINVIHNTFKSTITYNLDVNP